MAETTYTKDGYYFKVNRCVLKNGTYIYDESGNSVFSLFPLNLKDYNDIVLNYSDTDLGKKHSYLKDTKLDDSEFAKILNLIRNYALEKNINLFIESDIQRTYDIQNFVLHGGETYVPMSNHEILKVNENGLYVHVQVPERNYYDKLFTHIYITSSGRITLENHNFENTTVNYITYRKNTNDYSNIISVSNRSESYMTEVYFEYNEDIPNNLYKLPENISNEITILLPLIHKSSPLGMMPLKIYVIAYIETHHKNLKIREIYPHQLIDRMKEAADILKSYAEKFTVDFNGHYVNSLDYFLKLNETHPYIFHRDQHYEHVLNEIKQIRINLSS